MFNKKPIQLVHTHVIEIEDLEEKTKPVFDEVKSILRNVGIVLLVGIPTTIILAAAARIGTEVVIDNIANTPPE